MTNQFTSLALFYDELMSHVPYRKWVNYVLQICDRHSHRPRQVLDCACGTGNVTYELARRDLQATGVDISSDMIAVARSKSAPGTTNPQFFQADLAAMELGQQFDTITCLYDSLNYLTSPELLERAFSRMRDHITPQGLFIFDMNSPYAFETNMFTQTDRSPLRKVHYDWVAHFDPQTRLCTVDMHYVCRVKNGTYTQFRETHIERSYAMSEVTELLENAGWELLESYDSYRLAQPHPRSERWFFAARPQ